MEIQRVGIAGCGLMGGGIAQVCARAGFQVTVREVEQRFLDTGLGAVAEDLARAVARGKLPRDEMEAALGRITGTTEIRDLGDSDIVIEAIIENPGAKTDLFAALDPLCPEHTIFASNTSSIPIIEIAAATRRPDRFLGLHFFNPVPVMQLVEVIRTIQSSDACVETATAFVRAIGKKTIQSPDRAGFIVNVLLVPYCYDAIRLLEMGVASREDIDTGMVLGCNYPMGPLTLSDYVGLDTLAAIGEVLFDEFREARFAAPPLLRKMVKAGFYGRKSGKGFYDYAP